MLDPAILATFFLASVSALASDLSQADQHVDLSVILFVANLHAGATEVHAWPYTLLT
jgi:hypothetical protein